MLVLPSWVSNEAVAIVHQSATIAGFDILSSISQPAAACLAYDLLDDKEQNMLVFFVIVETQMQKNKQIENKRNQSCGKCLKSKS